MFEPKIIKKIEKAHLIGRGCGVYPVAKKWRMVRSAKGDNKYVICNVSESEPGLFKDKYILQNFAERVMDGIKIALDTLGAQKGFIYLNPGYYGDFQDHLQAIIDGEKLVIELYQKPLHDYVGGEETAVINSMEGKRVEPRLKPPYPTQVGFYNQPTLINNCETFYHVSCIDKGEYRGTKFYCISGDGVEDKVVELPENLTIGEVLEKSGCGPDGDFFVQVGGAASGTVYNSDQLDKPLGGLAAVIIYDKKRDEKDIVMKWLRFFEDESCGQCVPCREGTFRLKQLVLEDVGTPLVGVQGEDTLGGSLTDHEQQLLDTNRDNMAVNASITRATTRVAPTGGDRKKLLNDLIFTMQKTSFCPVGKVASNALVSYWKNVKERDSGRESGAETCEV